MSSENHVLLKSANAKAVSAKQSQKSEPAPRYVMIESVSRDTDDEINLLDLWVVLVKRRYLFLVVSLIVLLAGIAFSYFNPVKYVYSTVIEIGVAETSEGGKQAYIEDPKNVLAKIKQSYVPLMLNNYSINNQEFKDLPVIRSRLEGKSNIIYIDLKGVEKNKAAYLELLDSIVDKVKRDHLRISLLNKKNLELSKYRKEHQILRLKDQEKLLLSQNKRLDKKEKLLEKRIREIKGLLVKSAKLRQLTASEPNTEGQALALMMVDGELRESRETLARLEDQLIIGLQNSREVMLNKLTANRQLQAEQAELRDMVTMKMDNLLETRAITEPLQSIKPVGAGKKVIVGVSLILGLLIAVFAVFIVEFFDKAKRHAEKI